MSAKLPMDEIIAKFRARYHDMAARLLDCDASRVEVRVDRHPDGSIQVWVLLDGEYVSDEQATLIDETMRSLIGPTN